MRTTRWSFTTEPLAVLFTRGLFGTASSLGPSSTGPIQVASIAGTVGNAMQGRDSETDYTISWTATKTP